MQEALTVVRVGAKGNRDRRAGNLKNPLSRGRGSESGADVVQVIRPYWHCKEVLMRRYAAARQCTGTFRPEVCEDSWSLEKRAADGRGEVQINRAFT